MADNVTFQSGTLATVPDGSIVAADTIAGVLHQRVKIEFGVDGTATDVSATNPLPVTLSTGGADEIATNQVSVATTVGGTLIVAARAGRQDVTITNHGTTDVFLGNTGVATTTGMLLVGIKGGAITISGSAAIFGIVSASTQTVSYLETF